MTSSRGTKRKATDDDKDNDHQEKKYKTELLDQRTTKDKVLRGRPFDIIIEFADVKDMSRWIGVDKWFSLRITTNYAQHWKHLAVIGIMKKYNRDCFNMVKGVFIEGQTGVLCPVCKALCYRLVIFPPESHDRCWICHDRDSRLRSLQTAFSIRHARGLAMMTVDR
jgi:hypothetical protein